MKPLYYLLLTNLKHILIYILNKIRDILISPYLYAIIAFSTAGHYFKKLLVQDKQIAKLQKIKVRQVEELPEVTIPKQLFSSSKQSKLKEVFDLLSKAHGLRSINYKHNLSKEEEGKRFMELEVIIAINTEFKNLVQIIEIVRKIGYKIISVDIKHSGPDAKVNTASLEIDLKFSCLYTE